MYLDYFGLHEKPFSIAPDPRYLFMSEQHQDALAHLLYGIRTEGGFVLLTGEVGTGKTTVCRCLLEQMPAECVVAFVLNPRLTALELVATICDEFRVPYTKGEMSIKQLVDRLVAFLLETHAAGRNPVLIIDEAQNLAPDVLEQLRLLTNLETSRKKLLQVVLLGQPELRDLLARPELRQLSQRVTARFHLGPLRPHEIGTYLRHRLSTAGCDQSLFPSAVEKQLARLSGGVPRLLNLLCDRALLGTFVEGKRQVDRRIIARAAKEVFGEEPSAARRPAPWWLGVGGALLVGVVVGGLVWSPLSTPRADQPVAPQFAAPPVDPKPAEPTLPNEAALSLPQNPVAANPDPPPPDWPDSEPAGSVTTPADTELSLVGANSASAEALFAWLAIHQGREGRETALNNLMELWGVTGYVGDACTVAETQGLRCLEAGGSIAVLRRLNRPVMLTLVAPDGRTFRATLTRLAGGEVELRLGEEQMVISTELLLEYWLGSYLVVWQPPPGYRQAMSPGENGEAVEWLAARLVDLQRLQPEEAMPPVRLERALLESVKSLQGESGLQADGIVGPRTLIELNSRLRRPGPRLQESRT